MKNKIKTYTSTALLAVGVITGSVMVANPAIAGQSGSAFAGPFHSSAKHEVWGGTKGLSVAKHGCKVASTGWTTSGGTAWAACGFDLNSYAYNSYK